MSRDQDYTEWNSNRKYALMDKDTTTADVVIMNGIKLLFESLHEIEHKINCVKMDVRRYGA